MKSNGVRKRWGAMTAAELAEATKEFDRPLPASRYKPLTKTQRAQFERARRAGLGPNRRAGAIDLNPRLMKEATAYAKKNGFTVTQVLERGLLRELAVKD